MTNAPLVSVVIPTYNRALLIERALRSALLQTFTDHEVLVIDDASTDNTEEVIRAFNDDRIRYIRLNSNVGGASARNEGIRLAKGKFVAFLDSDDAWLPEKLERQLAFVSGLRTNTEDAVYYTQSIKDDGYRRVVRPSRGKRPNESVASYVFSRNLDINTIVALMPTALARQVWFKEGLERHQEVDFFVRLEAAGACFFFQAEPLSVYYCDDRPERISMSTDIGPSVRWYESVAEHFTARASRGFYAKVIAPRLALKGRRVEAAALILKALGTGSISPINAAKYLAESLLTNGAQRWLKSLVSPKSKPA